MKILIGVDDSPCSQAAVEYVRQASWPAKTKVIVLSAVRPAVIAYSEIYVPAPAAIEEAVEEQMRISRDLTSQVGARLREVGLSAEARVLLIDPREGLVQVALETGADLIVVGSHGRSGIAKLLLGSVASHVVTHAPCNVLVVKRKGQT